MHRFTFFFTIFLTGVVSAGEHLLVSAGSQITSFQIDESTGQLTQTDALELGLAGPMTEGADGKTLYINTGISEPSQKKKSPAIGTFRCSADGKLSLIKTVASQMSAGYLRTDSTGRFLAGSNYGGGQVSIWALSAGGVFDGGLVRTFDLERCAHSAVFSPDNRTLYVPATGPNKIFQLKFDGKSGEVVPSQPSSAPGPTGEGDAKQPRHLVFHPSKPLAYVTHERELAGAGVYAWDESNGTLSLVQSVVSVDPKEEGMTTADLHLSPDARFLCVSNRDIANAKNPDLGRDSIALFKVDAASGELSFVKRFACPKVPRSFCRNASGSLLFVSGQGDNQLATYKIDPKTGHLLELGRMELAGRPSWVMCVSR